MNQVMTPEWINSDIDIAACCRELHRNTRLQISNFLRPDIAQKLQHCLLHEVPWDVALRDGGQSRTVRAEQWQQMPVQEKNALIQRVYANARTEFQFFYESFMMVTAYKEKRLPHLILHPFLEFLNSPDYLHYMRQLTGLSDIRKSDAQATRYMPGHFLQRHNDTGSNGELRRVAYVYSFCQQWEPDWGGVLHFLDDKNRVPETFVPAFNTLNLFLTPQMHEVSFVAPYAAAARISITGWLRAD